MRTRWLLLYVLAACGTRERETPPPPAVSVDAPPGWDAIRRARCASLTPGPMRERLVRVEVGDGGEPSITFKYPAEGGYLCELQVIRADDEIAGDPLWFGGKGIEQLAEARRPARATEEGNWLYAIDDPAWDRELVEIAADLATLDDKRRRATCDALATRRPPDPSEVRPVAEAMIAKFLEDGVAEPQRDEVGDLYRVGVHVGELRGACGFPK